MSDAPALGLYVWSLFLWVAGIERERGRWMIAAAVLMGLCALTKYFGITAVGLAAVFAIGKLRKPGRWCACLAIPLLMLLLYSLHSERVYGRNHFLFAREFAGTVRDYLGQSLLERTLVVIPYLGVMALPWLLFLVTHAGRRERKVFAAGLAATLGIGLVASGSEAVMTFYGLESGGAIGYIVLAFAGAFLTMATMVVAAKDVFVRRDASTVFLAVWLMGVLVYAIAVAPILGARVLLPALPAMGLILARQMPIVAEHSGQFGRGLRASAWVLAASLATGVLVGDYVAADRDRRAAEYATNFAAESNAPLRYYGTWGFQYYVEEAGAQPFVATPREDGRKEYSLEAGMLIVVPQMYGAVPMPEALTEVVAEFTVEEQWPVATWDAKSRAGFYGEFLGLLPYAFDSPRQHAFVIYRVTNAP
jgi:hypothetical protein